MKACPRPSIYFGEAVSTFMYLFKCGCALLVRQIHSLMYLSELICAALIEIHTRCL